MKKIIQYSIVLGLLSLLPHTPLSAQGWEWVRKAGGSGTGTSGTDEEGMKIASDANGNVYVAGIMYPNAIFDTILLPGHGNSDYFLASYDSLGNIRWAKSFGTSVQDDFDYYGIAVDHQNNVYFTGGLQAFGQMYLGDTTVNVSGAQSRFFISSYTSSGTLRWARISQTPSTGYAIAVDSSFGVACGYRTISTGTLYSPFVLPPGYHLLRFNHQGDYLDHFAIGNNLSGSFHNISDIKIFKENIFFAGLFNSTASVLDDTLSSLSTATNANAYVAYIDTSATVKKTIGLLSNSSVSRLSLACINDTILLLATVSSQFYVGNTLTTGTFAGQLFLGKVDLNGNLSWFNRSSGTATNFSGGLSVNQGRINVTGSHAGTTSWLGGSLTSTHPGYNPLFVQLTTSGNLIRMTELPGSGFNDYGNAVTSTGVITGSFEQSLFGFNDTVTKTGGGSDIFIARFNPNLIVTGVSPEVVAQQVALYPNPLGQGVGLHISLGSYEQAELRVFDLQGKEVHRSMFQGPEATVQFRTIAPGQYLWQLQLGKKRYKGKLRVEG
jgi:hypothetical protein